MGSLFSAPKPPEPKPPPAPPSPAPMPDPEDPIARKRNERDAAIRARRSGGRGTGVPAGSETLGAG